MATQAQIGANQANAQKSTGPTSTEGKAASAQNNFRHGFRGKFDICGSEDPNEYRKLLNALMEEHKPETITEQLLVENMAEHYWLVRRARNLQFAAFDAAHKTGERAGSVNQDLDIQNMLTKKLALWQRYETQHDRAFHKCLADLRKVRGERHKEQIGFERQKQMEAAEARKQEAHAAKTRLTNAKSDELELNTAIKAMIQAPCPGDTAASVQPVGGVVRDNFDLNDLKRAIQLALHTLSAKKAEDAA